MSANYPKAVVTAGQQRVYRVWGKMRERCTNPNADSFKNYGAKGIQVCEAWASFEAFAAWATANGYADHLTIERRDSAGNYEPDNCTWATRTEQNRNRAIVHRAPDGRSYAEIAEAHGITTKVYHNRLHLGWSPAFAAQVPNRGKHDGARTRLVDYTLGDDGKVYLR